MIDYTAMDCVKFGDLLGALSEDKVDEDILQVSGTLNVKYNTSFASFQARIGPIRIRI
jgi:hypothetical protein